MPFLPVDSFRTKLNELAQGLGLYPPGMESTLGYTDGKIISIVSSAWYNYLSEPSFNLPSNLVPGRSFCLVDTW